MMCVALLGLALAAQEAPRQRPPDDFPCPERRITSFRGVVKRIEGRRITIRTDWDTTERFTLPEKPKGKRGDRVTVWLCEPTGKIRVDW